MRSRVILHDLAVSMSPRPVPESSGSSNRRVCAASAARGLCPEAASAEAFPRSTEHFWVVLSQLWPRWKGRLVVVRPETVIRWHRQGFRRYWRSISTPGPGRPAISREVQELIVRMATENAWRARKIQAELSKLGIRVSLATVSRYVPRSKPDPTQQQRWMTFLRNHKDVIAGMDFFVVPTVRFRLLWVGFAIDHGRRERFCTSTSPRTRTRAGQSSSFARPSPKSRAIDSSSTTTTRSSRLRSRTRLTALISARNERLSAALGRTELPRDSSARSVVSCSITLSPLTRITSEGYSASTSTTTTRNASTLRSAMRRMADLWRLALRLVPRSLDCRASAVFPIDIDGAKQPDEGPRRPNSGQRRARMNNENRQVPSHGQISRAEAHLLLPLPRQLPPQARFPLRRGGR